jgi:hypothetical protein
MRDAREDKKLLNLYFSHISHPATRIPLPSHARCRCHGEWMVASSVYKSSSTPSQR